MSFLGQIHQFDIIAPFRYYKWLYLIILPLYPFLLDLNGFYSRAHTLARRNTVWILLKSCAICTLAVMAAMYFFKLAMLSRGVVVIFALFSIVALFAKDRLFQAHMRNRALRGKDLTEVILVGLGRAECRVCNLAGGTPRVEPARHRSPRSQR